MYFINCDICGKSMDPREDPFIILKPSFINCDEEDVSIQIDPEGYAYHIECIEQLHLRQIITFEEPKVKKIDNKKPRKNKS